MYLGGYKSALNRQFLLKNQVELIINAAKGIYNTYSFRIHLGRGVPRIRHRGGGGEIENCFAREVLNKIGGSPPEIVPPSPETPPP